LGGTVEISLEEFDGYVAEAIGGIDAAFRGYLDEVPVVVEDRPDATVRREMKLGRGRRLLGLFRGVPLNRRSVEGIGGPNQIVLYRENIVAACGSREEVAEQIRRTLVHELGHYVGFSEGQLRERDY